MNTIPPPQKENPHIQLTSSQEIQEQLYPFHHEINITDGAEFLDDAIRTKDQPLYEATVKESQPAFAIAFYKQDF